VVLLIGSNVVSSESTDSSMLADALCRDCLGSTFSLELLGYGGSCLGLFLSPGVNLSKFRPRSYHHM
jgi:hypothetical protein